MGKWPIHSIIDISRAESCVEGTIVSLICVDHDLALHLYNKSESIDMLTRLH